MKIYPGEKPFGQVSHNRFNEPTALQMGSRKHSASKAEAAQQPVPEIRKQLLVVQRSLGRFQSMLGGLEGFKVLLRTEATTAKDYVRHVVYHGEAVLQSYSEQLDRILQNKDQESLQRLIADTKTEIHGLAVELSRLETAEQNSRALVLGEAALSGVLDGIRNRGDQLLNLEGKNVLDLLG
jgi:hypothetical protein